MVAKELKTRYYEWSLITGIVAFDNFVEVRPNSLCISIFLET